MSIFTLFGWFSYLRQDSPLKSKSLQHTACSQQEIDTFPDGSIFLKTVS